MTKHALKKIAKSIPILARPKASTDPEQSIVGVTASILCVPQKYEHSPMWASFASCQPMI